MIRPPSNIGSTIKELRCRSRMKQKDFAAWVGISPGYLSDIEAGKKLPTLETLYRIAHTLNIQASELLYMAEGTQEPTP